MAYLEGTPTCKNCPTNSEPRLNGYFCESCPRGHETIDELYGCRACDILKEKREVGPGKCVDIPPELKEEIKKKQEAEKKKKKEKEGKESKAE